MRHSPFLLIPAATLAALAFAGTASAWHINSGCSNSQWVVGIPNEAWATGTTATLDFNQGPDATAGKGQSVVAPAAATSVVVSFSNSGEHLSATRPQGCVVVTTTTIAATAVTTTNVAPTTTTVAPPASTIVATDDEITPVVVVAVADPPVPPAAITPEPQGVSAEFSQSLPVTGGATSTLWYAAALVACGFVGVAIARRRE